MSTETQLATVNQSSAWRTAEVPTPPVPGAPDSDPPRHVVAFPVLEPPGPASSSSPRVPSNHPGWDAGLAVRAVRRHWLLAVVLGAVVGGGAAAAVWHFLPPGRQSACTVLHISDQQPVLLQATPESQINAAVYRQRQQQAVTSMKVLETVFADPAVTDLPLAGNPNRMVELERRIKIDFKLGQEFMRVSVESPTPEESLILVTSLKDAYLSQVVNKERGIWERSVAKREEALKEAEAVFERNRAELAKKLEPFKLKPSDAAFIPRLRQSAEEKHQQKESELRQVLARIRTLEIEEKSELAREEEKIVIPEVMIDEELDREPQFASLRAKTVSLEKELATSAELFIAGSTPPVIVKLRKAVEAARQAEVEHRASIRPRIEARLVTREREKRRGDTLIRNREMERYRDWQTALLGDIEQSKAEAIRMSGASVEIEAIGQTVARQEKQITEDRNTIARQRREVESAPARVSEHEPPRVVPLDEFRRRLKYSGMTGLFGLGLVLVAFVGLERLRNRISDPDQVAGLTLPVLGTLPNLDTSNHVTALRGADWSIAVEAIDMVRTMMLHAVGPTGPRVLMVSSAAPGEGKTTLTGCLAESLARAGYRTLLVDGDLRRPTAHSRYRTPTGPGIAQILRGEATVRACCVQVAELGLWALPAGWDSAASSELLPKGAWWRLIQDAREQFDFVVVDTSPLLSVVDPVLMARACDGVVLAVLRDVSRMDLLAEAANRLRTLGIPILGCVVHRAYRPPNSEYYSPRPDPVLRTEARPAHVG
jgi:succinoglycan biosynthesis transport protein ExoP